MKVEIHQDLQNEIMNFIENNSKDDAEAFALVEEVYNAIKAEKAAYEDYLDDLVNGIGEQV